MTQNNVIPFPMHRVGAYATRMAESFSETAKQRPGQSEPNSQIQIFEIHKYLPKGRPVTLIETSRGTHQIPHKIFEFLIKATTSRVEVAVLACLMRYTLGFHRSTCEASYSFISAWTGLSIASVRRGLDTLLKEELIRCVESGNNSKESTVYELPLVRAYLTSIENVQIGERSLSVEESRIDNNSKTMPGQIEHPEGNPLCRQEAQYCAPSVHRTMPPVGTKKDTPNIQNKTLTHEKQKRLPEYLEAYFLNLKPRNKKVREQRHFESLRTDYDVQDISDAVRLLIEKGIPGSGEHCHSPLAFLSCSMSNVLSHLRAQREKLEKRERLNQQEIEKKKADEKAATEENQQFQAVLNLFNQAFPTEALQKALFDEFGKEFPFYKSSQTLLKTAAIRAWYARSKKSTHQL